MSTIVAAYASSEPFADPQNINISAVGSGNTVIVIVQVGDGNQPVSVSDDQANVYTQDFSAVNNDGGGDHIFFRASNVTNAPTQIQINLNGAGGANRLVLEVSGLDNSSPVGQTQGATGSSATPSVGFTTTTANELVVASFDFTAGTSFTADSGYTERPPDPDPIFATFATDDDIGAAGSYTAGGTVSGSVGWSAAVVTYKAAAGGGGSSILKHMMHYYQ